VLQSATIITKHLGIPKLNMGCSLFIDLGTINRGFYLRW